MWPHDDYLTEENGFWHVRATKCPTCKRAIIGLRIADGNQRPLRDVAAWPRRIARAPLPPEVTDPFATDYREACLVLTDSPKASAALSRRCLQRLLREKAGVKPSDLYEEISEVLASKTLPTHLAEAIDAIRQIGKFAAHPNKSKHTGEILDVEPGEADWSLDVLESLFDFYFVEPARLAAKKDALNKKLGEAGQKPMK
jgi:hypothetical protein